MRLMRYVPLLAGLGIACVLLIAPALAAIASSDSVTASPGYSGLTYGATISVTLADSGMTSPQVFTVNICQGDTVVRPLHFTASSDGTYSAIWDGMASDGSPAASGTYMFNLLSSGGALLASCSGTVDNTGLAASADSTAPVTTVVLSGTPGNNGWFKSGVIATLYALDNLGGSEVASIMYHLDAAADQTASGDMTSLTISNGSHTLYYSSKDNQGNTETRKSVSINVDFAAPTTTASAPTGTGGWYTGPVTLTATDNTDGSGVASISYSIDGAAPRASAGASVAVTIPDGAAHTLTYWSTDIAGNSEAPHTMALKMDAIAPVTTVTVSPQPNVNGWATSDEQLTFSATDATTEVDHIEYSVGSTSSWVVGISLLLTSNGQTTVYYRAVDHAGNVETYKSIVVGIDKTTPGIAWSANTSPTNGWYNHYVVINYSSDGGFSGVWSLTPDQTLTVTGQSSGSITNKAGRSASITTPTIYIDNTAPVITASVSPQANSNGWYNVNVNVNFTATDALSGMDYVYGNTTLTGDGYGQSVTGSAKDKAGNTATSVVNGINIDKTGPSLGLTITPSPNWLGWYLSNAVVNVTASDDMSGVSGIWINLDGHGWSSYSGNFTIGDGVHTLEYKATDKAGNTASNSRTIDVDTISPSSSVVLSGTKGLNGWYTSNVTASINAIAGSAGVDHTEYSYDGVNWLRGNTYYLNAEGANTSYYRSYDLVGNVEPYKMLYVTIDRSAPTVTDTLDGHVGSNGWFDSDVKVTLYATDSVSGVDHTEYSIDGTNWYSYTGAFKVSLDKRKWIYYRSTDYAGNVGSGSIFINFPPPSIDFIGIIGGLLGVPTATPVPTPGPDTTSQGSTSVAAPTPAAATATTEPAQGTASDNGMSPAVYIGVAAILAITAGSIYFLFRKK